MTIPAKKILDTAKYDRESGEVFCKKTGKRLDWHSHQGYRAFRVDGKKIYVHRAAFVFESGDWPNGLVDHIDGNPSNNSLSNLRVCDKSENMRNRASLPKNNSSGVVGVSFDKYGGNWRACIVLDGKTKWLGRFKSKEDAIAARLYEERRVWGDFAPVVNRQEHSFLDLPHFELAE